MAPWSSWAWTAGWPSSDSTVARMSRIRDAAVSMDHGLENNCCVEMTITFRFVSGYCESGVAAETAVVAHAAPAPFVATASEMLP